jgi:hypothetical protein
VPHGHRDESLLPYSRLSRPEPLLFLLSSSSVVLTRLSWPRYRPTTSKKKSGSAWNRTRDIQICSQELWPLYHRGGHGSDTIVYKLSITFIRGLAIAEEPTVDIGFVKLTHESFCGNRVLWIKESPVLRRHLSRRPPVALYSHKLALTSPTRGGRSAGVVRSWTQATEYVITYQSVRISHKF